MFGFPLLFAVLALQGAGSAQQKPTQKPAVPKPDPIDVFNQNVIRENHISGISLVVVKDGKVIKAKGYGFANVEHNVPVTMDTVFLLASITKSFTATAVMMLVQEGKLKVDEHISTYLPETPPSWKDITVRHLLTHTAGLKDRFEGRTAGEWLLTFTKDEMYKSARAQPLDFSPGTGWQYSDQGYFLLGKIIEEVSGQTYRQFLADRIFKPLDMTSTSTISQNEIVKHLASGYTQTGGIVYHNHRRTEYGLVSHFGIISTALDMAKFDASLNTEKLLKRSTLEEMWTPAQLIGGRQVASGQGSYGLGWFLNDFFGHRIIQHGGATGTVLYRLPDDHLTVIVLTNLEMIAGGDAPGIARIIAGYYVPALTWKVHKPQPDPEPKFTATLRAEIARMSEGKIDLSLYEEKYGKLVAPAVAQQKRFYSGIGVLESFDYLGARSSGKARAVYYRAIYKQMTLYYSITLDENGKIAGVIGEPELGL